MLNLTISIGLLVAGIIMILVTRRVKPGSQAG